MARFALLGLLACSVIATAVLTLLYLQERGSIREQALGEASAEADAAAAAIENQLRVLRSHGDALATELEQPDLDISGIPARLDRHLEEDSLFGIGVAFEPDVLRPGDPPQERAWYHWRHPTASDGIQRDVKQYEYADRSDPANDWFCQAADSGRAEWKEPYFGRSSQTFIAGYAVPVNRAGHQRPVGVVTVNHSLHEITSIMRSLNIWRHGYGVLFSARGRVIYHPDQSVTTGGDTRLAEDILLQQLAGGQIGPGAFQRLKNDAGQAVWALGRRIGDTGWTLRLALSPDEMLSDNHYLVQLERCLTLAYVLLVIAAAATILLGRHSGGVGRLWLLATITTCAFIGGSMVIWHHNLDSLSASDPFDRKLKNQAAVEAYRSEVEHWAQASKQGEPIFVPTGCLVKSLTFDSANDVTLSGYVWQRYPAALLEGDHAPLVESDLGLLFNEASATDIDLVADEASYDHIDPVSGDRHLRWHFQVTLRQIFTYDQFPFDHEVVWMRMQHLRFDRGVVLVPDLDRYTYLHQTALPGIDDNDFVLPGWRFESTFFDYRFRHYTTDLGMISGSVLARIPELSFNIGLRRDFFDPLISRITPVLIIFFLLFAVVLVSQVGTDHGFTTVAILGLIAALLFTTMYLHNSLRQELDTGHLSYFEWFYLLGYLMMVLVVFNAVAIGSGSGSRWQAIANGPLPRLWYWPLVTGSIFIVTLFALQM